MKTTNLRRLLFVDAAISGVSGVLLLAAASPLARLLALPEPLLRYSGFSLLLFAALVLYLATRDILPRGGVLTIIALNIAWVVASAALLLTGGVAPNALGYAFVIVQAIAVAALAEMQYMGLRRVAPLSS
jgi:hypothetical protein